MENNAAFNKSLVSEAVTIDMVLNYDFDKNIYENISHEDLYEFAKIIAYKVAENLENGLIMNEQNNKE